MATLASGWMVQLQAMVGYSVASGDINHEGKADLIVEAYGADFSGADAGSTYGIYGMDDDWPASPNVHSSAVP